MDDVPEQEHDVERGALHEIAEANSEATWGDTGAGRSWVPGMISGDLGPKGKVAAQLRDTARSERAKYGEVPRGAIAPGSGGYLLMAIVGMLVVLAVVVAIIIWAAS